MTIKDGFKLGIGILLANVVVNIIFRLLFLAWMLLVR